ncbi:MAG TPA: RraA family protein [Clostridia bacterium]|jgi:RraA family protein|nr:RraA family protein [Clostridia bacterium]HPY42742.1 RraA family protein [Clostridia bacterium]HQA96568.1 RraA family protein [Clostridia bacterium]HQO54715.1 RraA family protein [Clostridia bacterium]
MSNIGNRAYMRLNRADKEMIELFRDMPVACIADNMSRITCMDQSLVNYGGSATMAGSAFTVKVPEGDNLLVHMSLDMIKEGDVLVIDGGGCMHRSLVGEIMCTYAYKKGCAGIVVDGVIRDVARLKKLPIPIYAKGVQPNGPYKDGLGEINAPVAVGGIVVFPGDIMIGDEDGVVAIRPGEARELSEKVRATVQAEDKVLEKIHASGEWNRKVFQDAIEQSKVQKIDDCYK